MAKQLKKPRQLDDLLQIQGLMAKLEFALDSNRVYTKDYGLADGGMVRLTPVFDKGSSVDSRYELTGLHLQTTTFVPVAGDRLSFEKFPRVCLDDISALFAQLVPGAVKQIPESFIITAECTKCNKTVSSYVMIKNRATCLECLE